MFLALMPELVASARTTVFVGLIGALLLPMKLLPDSNKFFEVDGIGLVIVDDDDDDDDDDGFLALLLLDLSTSVVSSSDMITIAFDSLSFVCSG